MADNATDYLENKILDHILGKTAYTKPTTYLGLFSAAPGEGGGGTELSGSGYARQALSPNTTAAASGAAENSALIEFGPATANWSQATHFGVFDASTGGNLLIYFPLTVAKTVLDGEKLQVAIGALDFTAA